jgi:hypothetical protein
VYRLSGTKIDGDGGVCCETPNATPPKDSIQTTEKTMEKSLSFMLKISSIKLTGLYLEIFEKYKVRGVL